MVKTAPERTLKVPRPHRSRLSLALALALATSASCASPRFVTPPASGPLAAPGRAPASLWSDCRSLFEGLVVRKRADPYLDDPATQRARAAIQELDAECRGVSVPEDHAFLLLSEKLQADDLQALFKKSADEGSRRLEPSELDARLRGVTGRTSQMYGVVDRLQSLYSLEHATRSSLKASEREQQAFDRVRSKVEAAAKKTPAEKQALHADIDRRRKLARLDRLLEDPAMFGVAIGEKEARFPGGVVYPVIRKDADGTVVIGIPYANILTTQDYFNPEIAARYRADPGLKKMVFDGTWLPDGRVLILDQHHRTAAYHGKIGDPVPFVLRPDLDGTYRSSSYLFAMKFYTSWGMIPEREKLEILEEIEKIRADPGLTAPERDSRIRTRLEGLYHRTLRLRPLASDAATPTRVAPAPATPAGPSPAR